jgi:hypothetical protein
LSAVLSSFDSSQAYLAAFLFIINLISVDVYLFFRHHQQNSNEKEIEWQNRRKPTNPISKSLAAIFTNLRVDIHIELKN